MALAPKTRDQFALAFAMLFPVCMAWLYFVALATEQAQANSAVQVAFAVGKLVQGLFPALYVWWFERERLVLRRPTFDGLALGAGFGLLAGAAIVGLYFLWFKSSPLLGHTPQKILHKLQESGMASPGAYLGMSVFYCVAHSLFEEYYWRWFVFGTLRRHVSAAGANVLSSLGFMLHHVVILGVFFPGRFWTLALPFSLGVAVGGAVWAWIYHRTGSLYAAWLSHALIDAALMAVGYDMVAPFFRPVLFDGIQPTPAP